MKYRPLRRGHEAIFLLTGMILTVFIMLGCGCCSWDLDLVDYSPHPGDDWEVSTPEAEGLDPMLLAELYFNAAKVETLHALLVVKNGYLIAEGYFNGGGVDQKTNVTSVTKSYTSALVGVALDQGYLTSLDQKMVDFFPEFLPMQDQRKEEITIRQMLKMRAGYPEELNAELLDMMYGGFRTRYLADLPLARDPGAGMEYSNLTSHLLSAIVTRAVGMDLLAFAETNLFTPNDEVAGDWIKDWEGNRNGHSDLHLTARDMAKFGRLYLDDGVYQGIQIIPKEWVKASLQTYSEDAFDHKVGRNFTEIGYGYQWWSARAGDHQFSLAWGHGGQQIVLLDELNMVIVVKAETLLGEYGSGPWRREKANLNLVADFISSMPIE